jgi:CRP-like cAMP-binding protein
MPHLRPTAVEKITEAISVPKCVCTFQRWRGKPVPDTYGGKMVLRYRNQPLFAELVVLRLLKQDGWKGVWVDSFRRKCRVSMPWIGKPIELDDREGAFLKKIRDTMGCCEGCWDVFARRGVAGGLPEVRPRMRRRIPRTKLVSPPLPLRGGCCGKNPTVGAWKLLSFSTILPCAACKSAYDRRHFGGACMSFDPHKASIPGDSARALAEALDRVATRHTCSRGEVLFQQGQLGHGVLVLRRGTVELFLSSADGSTRLPYRTVGPGYVLGLPALFSGKPFSLSAEALEECEFSLVPREAALQLMRDRLDLCLQAASQLASEVTTLSKLQDVSAQPSNPVASPNWSNRRRFARYRTNLPLRIRDHLQRNLDARCNIIAQGGLGAVVSEPLLVGSMGLLQFAIPTQPDPLRVWSFVRYQQELRHAFEFVLLTETERLSIRQFCNELAIQALTKPLDS